MCHYHRGWSHLGHYVIHLGGCPLVPSDSRLSTCLKMIFLEWTQPTWRLPFGNNHWPQRHHTNAVIHPVTGKEVEYSALMKDTCLQPLWTRGFGNECGRLFQGIQDIPEPDTCFFIELKKHPRRQKYHLQQNSLRLQTTQARKVTRSAHRRRRQTRLLRRRRHFNSRYHIIQNPDQQHRLHRGRRHDDDGHQELLYRHPAATV
jgi:hypothetical protein